MYVQIISPSSRLSHLGTKSSGSKVRKKDSLLYLRMLIKHPRHFHTSMVAPSTMQVHQRRDQAQPARRPLNIRFLLISQVLSQPGKADSVVPGLICFTDPGMVPGQCGGWGPDRRTPAPEAVSQPQRLTFGPQPIVPGFFTSVPE